MSNHTVGRNAVCEALVKGTLHDTLNRMMPIATQADADLFSGAVSGLLDAYKALQDAGVVFDTGWTHGDALLKKTPSNLGIDIIKAFERGDVDVLSLRLNYLTNAVHAGRHMLTTKAVEPPPPMPVDVRVINLPEPTPQAIQQVQVVSMPTRTSSTTIKRDEDGAIVESTAVERDAPDGPIGSLAGSE